MKKLSYSEVMMVSGGRDYYEAANMAAGAGLAALFVDACLLKSLNRAVDLQNGTVFRMLSPRFLPLTVVVSEAFALTLGATAGSAFYQLRNYLAYSAAGSQTNNQT